MTSPFLEHRAESGVCGGGEEARAARVTPCWERDHVSPPRANILVRPLGAWGEGGGEEEKAQFCGFLRVSCRFETETNRCLKGGKSRSQHGAPRHPVSQHVGLVGLYHQH